MNITQERLKQVVHYNPETGVFTWLVNLNSRARRGEIAGKINQEGYLRSTIDGKEYRLSRLAVLYMTGVFPEQVIDHKNRVRDDNRWCNLRVCSRGENQRNSSNQVNNTSGLKGVRVDRQKGRRPQVKGSVSYTGYIDYPDGRREWSQVRPTFSRTFIEGDEESMSKAIAEVTDWVKTTRGNYHGEFACD